METLREIMDRKIKLIHRLIDSGIKHDEVVLPLTIEEYDVLIDDVSGAYGSEITLLGFKTYIHGLSKNLIEMP